MSEENKNLSGSIPLMNPIRNAMGGYITSSDQIYDSKRDRSQEEVNDDLYTKIGSGSGSTTVVPVGEKDWFYIRTSGQLPEGAFDDIIPEKTGGELEGDSDYQDPTWLPGEVTVDGFVCSDWTKTQQGISNEWTVEYETYRQTYALGEELFWDAIRIPTIRSMKGERGNDAVAPAGVLTSFVFMQSQGTPQRPSAKEETIDGITYNNYNNPVPPKEEGWVDGIVTDGSNNPIYFSKRTFTSNKEGQDAVWSDPQIISDKPDIEYMFSNQKGSDEGATLIQHTYIKEDGTKVTFDKPNTNDINPEWLTLANANGWYDEVEQIEKLEDPTKRTVWRMAITSRIEGIWSSWEISQIRGEDGDAGTKFTIKGHVPTYDELLEKEAGINDAYVVDEDGHLYIWDGDSWTDCGKFSGKDGESYYLHIIYANLSKEGEEEAFKATVGGADLWLKLTDGKGETSGDYIGILADTNEEDPKEPEDLIKYKWQFWKGEDGFGVEYIYKATENFEAPPVPKPDYENSKWNDFDFLPDGWADNPISVDGSEGYKYCWVCHRTYANNQWNEWKGKNGYATLYSRYSKDIQPNLLLNSGFDRYTEVGSNSGGSNPPTESTPTEEPTTTTTTTPDQTTTPSPIALAAEEGSSYYYPFLCPYTNRYKIENWKCSDEGVTLAIDEGIDGTTILWVNQEVKQNKVTIIESPVAYLNDFNEEGADLYTLSFYVKGKAKLKVEILDEKENLIQSSTNIVIDQNNKTGQKPCDWNWEINTQNGDNVGKWERHSLTFGLVDFIRKEVKIRFSLALIEGLSADNYQSILLCMPKLERSEIPTAWCANRADLTGEGLGIFNSTVFTRTSGKQPDTPSGGYYYNPYPDDNITWSDGIPAFDHNNPCVWSSVATFRSNDPIDKAAEWSEPKLMVDSDSMDIEWSCVIENPGNPTDNKDNWFNNVNDKSQEIYWMAVRYKKAGSDGYGNWIISKIKGEDGKNGLSPEENLLDNSDFSLLENNIPKYWTSSANPGDITLAEEKFNGHNVLKIDSTVLSGNSAVYNILRFPLNGVYREDTWYTFSFYSKRAENLKPDDPVGSVFAQGIVSSGSDYYINNEKATASNNLGAGFFPTTEKWERYYITFQTKAGFTTINSDIKFSQSSTRDAFYLTLPKLEVANDQDNPQASMPTPWCRSQNDLKGDNGPAGERGPLLYPQGTWVSSETYTRTTDSAPFVYHEETQKYYVLEKEGSWEGKDPKTEEGKEYWGEFTNIKYVFTEALMAKWARLGEAVFYGDYMFSQEGVTSGGETKNYGEEGVKGNIFDNDGKLSGEFTPNLFMDFVSGLIKANTFNEPFIQIPSEVDMFRLTGKSGYNVSVQPRILKEEGPTPLIISMPNGGPILNPKTGENIAPINWEVDGANSTIIVQASQSYLEYKYSLWLSDAANWENINNHCVILCADGRFLDYRSYNNYTGSSQDFDPLLNGEHSTTFCSYFIVGGIPTRCLILLPGDFVKLKSCKTRVGGVDYLYWYVENSSDFKRAKADIILNNSYYLDKNGGTVGDGRVWTSVVNVGGTSLAPYPYKDGVTKDNPVAEHDFVYGSKELLALLEKECKLYAYNDNGVQYVTHSPNSGDNAEEVGTVIKSDISSVEPLEFNFNVPGPSNSNNI